MKSVHCQFNFQLIFKVYDFNRKVKFYEGKSTKGIAHIMRGTHVTGGTIGGWSRKKRDLACRNLRVDTWKGEEIHSSGRQRSQRTLFATPRPTPAASIKAESRSPNPPRPRLLCLSPLFLLQESQHTRNLNGLLENGLQ